MSKQTNNTANDPIDIHPRDPQVIHTVRELFESMTVSNTKPLSEDGLEGTHLLFSLQWSVRNHAEYGVASSLYVPGTTEEGEPVLYMMSVNPEGKVVASLLHFDGENEDRVCALFNMLVGFNY